MSTMHFVLFCSFSSFVVLSFFHYVIEFVGLSAVAFLVCFIHVLYIVSLAKLYGIKNLKK